MKNVGLFVVVLLVGLTAGFGLGVRYAQPKKEITQAMTPAVPATANAQAQPTVNPNAPPTAMDWDNYRRTKELVLHENPQLVVEYRELLDEMNQHQLDIEAAMVKCDLKVAPVIPKLDAIRQRSMAANLAGVPAH